MFSHDFLHVFLHVWLSTLGATAPLLWALLYRVAATLNPRLSSTPSQLTSLPSEVLLNISAYLDPTDILSLRQTCRRGQAVSNERVYWSRTHRQLQNTLPIPCHWGPLEGVLRTNEIEARVKWLLCLDRRWKSSSPTSANYATIPYSHKSSEGFRLLPGGRWLLIYTTDGVQVWDASGKAANAAQHLPSPPRPPNPADLFFEWDIDVTDLPAVYNVALVTDRRDHAKRLAIWLLDTSNTVHTRQLATYSLFQEGKRADQVSLYQDQVAFYCEGRTIAVFNWEQSRQDNYVAAVLQLSERCKEFGNADVLQLISHNRIVLLSGDGCALFEIPPLQFCESLDNVTHTDVVPVWTHSFESTWGDWPTSQRLLDTSSYAIGTVVLSWSQAQQHSLIVLPANTDFPIITPLEGLTFRSDGLNWVGQFRTVNPENNGPRLVLRTNSDSGAGGSDASLQGMIQLPHGLQSLIPEDERLSVHKISFDEGTGRICCVCWREHKTAKGTMENRGMADFIVILDLLVELS